MPESEISKDQTIEHLRRKLSSLQKKADVLSNALATVDRDVDKAAMKYLKPTVLHGQLRFSEFLELLVREIKREIKSQWRSTSDVRLWVKKAVAGEMEARIEKRIDVMMPSIRKKLSEYVTIPVILRKAPPRLDKPVPPFMAVAVRTKTRHGRGATSEEAYADLRGRLILSLAQVGPQALQHFDQNEWKVFQTAEPFRTEEIEGFKIVVRTEGIADAG